MRHVCQIALPRLNLECPVRIDIENQRAPAEYVAWSASSPSDFMSFTVCLISSKPTLRTIVIQNSVPILFRAEIRRVPSKIIHAHRAVRDRLKRPQSQLARVRLRNRWPAFPDCSSMIRNGLPSFTPRIESSPIPTMDGSTSDGKLERSEFR